MTAAARVHRTRSRVYEGNAFRASHIAVERVDERSAADPLLARLATKDFATWQHSKRVSCLAAGIGTELGLAPHVIRELTLAGVLHDVGKLTVPTYLLRKTDRLSAAEYAVVARHTVAGEIILANVLPGHPTVLAVARSHHERVDGTGLPDALARGYIPLAARIVCVADSFDAMTTNRPYQRARTYTEAAEELRRCTGRQFDASCVSALTRALSRASNNTERGLRAQKLAMV